MSSEGRSRGWLPLALAGALLAAGCGNKKPPQPPPRLVPANAVDLTVAQRGLELQLSFSYPATTASGLVLPGLEAVEVWRLSRPLRPPLALDLEGESAEGGEEAPVPAEPPPAAAAEPKGPQLFRPPADLAGPTLPEAQIQVGAPEFNALAELALRIEGAELSAAISGDRVLLRLPLTEPPAAADAPDEELEVEVLAVLSSTSKKLRSAFSNLVKILPRQPPAAPSGLDVQPGADGIGLTWQGDDPEVGFRIYRRDAASRAYGAPIAELAAEVRELLDTTAQTGERYVYSLTAVGLAVPLVESALAAEREVDYRDRYPPPAPTGLLLLAEPGRARLLWEPSDADDLAGYLVYRRETAGAGFVPLTAEPQLELGYLDSAVRRGRSYTYYVSAVDRSGNESEASDTAEALIP